MLFWWSLLFTTSEDRIYTTYILYIYIIYKYNLLKTTLEWWNPFPSSPYQKATNLTSPSQIWLPTTRLRARQWSTSWLGSPGFYCFMFFRVWISWNNWWILCVRVWIHNTCYSSHNHGSVENGVMKDVSLQMGYFPLPWLWEEGYFDFSRYKDLVCLFDSGQILMEHVFRARCFNGWHHSESTKGGKDLLTNRIGRVIWPIFPLHIFGNEDLIPISSLEFIVVLDNPRYDSTYKNAPRFWVNKKPLMPLIWSTCNTISCRSFQAPLRWDLSIPRLC